MNCSSRARFPASIYSRADVDGRMLLADGNTHVSNHVHLGRQRRSSAAFSHVRFHSLPLHSKFLLNSFFARSSECATYRPDGMIQTDMLNLFMQFSLGQQRDVSLVGVRAVLECGSLAPVHSRRQQLPHVTSGLVRFTFIAFQKKMYFWSALSSHSLFFLESSAIIFFICAIIWVTFIAHLVYTLRTHSDGIERLCYPLVERRQCRDMQNYIESYRNW